MRLWQLYRDYKGKHARIYEHIWDIHDKLKDNHPTSDFLTPKSPKMWAPEVFQHQKVVLNAKSCFQHPKSGFQHQSSGF